MKRNEDDLWFSGCDQGDPWGDSHPSWRDQGKKDKNPRKESPFDGNQTEKEPSKADAHIFQGANNAQSAQTEAPKQNFSGGTVPNFRGYTPRQGSSITPRRRIPIFSIIIVVFVMFVVLGLFNAVESIYNDITAPDGWHTPDWEDDDWTWGEDGDWDVETNEEADETYSIAPYEGDTSDLTVTLTSNKGKTALNYEELYEQCLPATVSITVYAGSSAAYGSGVVLTQDGFVLTCAHVTDDMESATVTVHDGTTYDALLVGSDEQTDLAILKIEADHLVPAQFGDSSELKIGETVCAIGDSLGVQFQSTLSNGIVSGLNREVSSNGYSMVLLQTTAAVNSGNSGGALFNEFGQVVGIVNMKMSNDTSYGPTVDNMGFAIPSTTVKDIVEGLATNGSIDRAVLGLSCYGIDTTTAVMSGLPEGLWVTLIQTGSRCGDGGLLEGDIITAVNGESVSSVADFKAATSNYEAGDTVTLTIWRDEALAERIAEADTDFDGAMEDDDEEIEYHFELYGDIEVELVSSSDLDQ